MTLRLRAWSCPITLCGVLNKSRSYTWTSKEISGVPESWICQDIPGIGCHQDLEIIIVGVETEISDTANGCVEVVAWMVEYKSPLQRASASSKKLHRITAVKGCRFKGNLPDMRPSVL
jgi:hypothetical protein